MRAVVLLSIAASAPAVGQEVSDCVKQVRIQTVVEQFDSASLETRQAVQKQLRRAQHTMVNQFEGTRCPTYVLNSPGVGHISGNEYWLEGSLWLDGEKVAAFSDESAMTPAEKAGVDLARSFLENTLFHPEKGTYLAPLLVVEVASSGGFIVKAGEPKDRRALNRGTSTAYEVRVREPERACYTGHYVTLDLGGETWDSNGTEVSLREVSGGEGALDRIQGALKSGREVELVVGYHVSDLPAEPDRCDPFWR